MSRNTLQKAASKIAHWRADPIAFVREVFDAEPDEWQKDFLTAYGRGDPRVFAKACKGPGKTTVLAWCCWHKLVCFLHPKIPCTSITIENLRNNLWAEMSKWQQKSAMLLDAFEWTAKRIFCKDHPQTWFMVALGWAQDANSEQQANSLAGYHADNIMFVLDEMGGIPDAVMAAAEATLANAGTEANPTAQAQIIGAGNPTHLTGPLYRACTTEASLCTVITITGDPDDPKRSKRISIQWARAQITKYGADNPWVLINVFGRFPPSSIDALLGPDEVEAAMKRVLPFAAYKDFPKVLGIDVGGGGNDPSALCPRQGLVYYKPKLVRLQDPKEIAGVAAVAIQRFMPEMTFVDNTGGFGSGVISYLRDWGYPVTGVLFSGSADDSVYHNKRTEMIYEFSYAVKGGACLPNIPALKEAICAQTYTHHRDKLLMTDKDQLKEGISDTTGFDMLDGYALTHAYPVLKKSQFQRPTVQPDYNPLSHMQQHGYEQKVDDYNPLG